MQELQSRLNPAHILFEPQSKNTAPCIAWAALSLLKEDKEAVMVVLPADHMIQHVQAFQYDIEHAISLAKEKEALVTIGIPPNIPHTGYGYIEANRNATFFDVTAFHEKPDPKTAQQYLQQGHFFWNSGIFVWKASTILSCFERYLPKHFNLLSQLSDDHSNLAEIYEQLESVSIDYGILEKAEGEIKMIPASFRWSDIGNWSALESFWEKDSSKNSSHGNYISTASHDNIVYCQDKLVALVDVRNLVIVETKDSILVMNKTGDQKIKDLYEKLPSDYK